jgi:long-chain fatty acid transport protein
MERVWTFDLEGFYVRPNHAFSGPGWPKANSRRDGVMPQGFAAYGPTPRLTLGFGVFLAYASSGVDWKGQDTGVPLKSAMGIYSFSPAITYRLGDFLSVGLALNFYRSALSLTAEMEPFGLITNDESGGAVSASLGLLSRPLPELSLGLCFKGPARMKTTGRTSLDIEGLTLRFPSETSFSLPWHIEAGLSYRLTPRFLFAVSAEYALWSSLKTLDKVFKDVPLLGDVAVPAAMNYRNILNLRAGWEWWVTSAFQVRAGFSWDPAASPEESLNLGNIDVDKSTVSLGGGWRTERTQLDFACGYAFGTSRSKRAAAPAFDAVETYDLDIFFVGLGLRFSMGQR